MGAMAKSGIRAHDDNMPVRLPVSHMGRSGKPSPVQVAVPCSPRGYHAIAIAPAGDGAVRPHRAGVLFPREDGGEPLVANRSKGRSLRARDRRRSRGGLGRRHRGRRRLIACDEGEERQGEENDCSQGVLHPRWSRVSHASRLDARNRARPLAPTATGREDRPQCTEEPTRRGSNSPSGSLCQGS